jgi:putative toxin-antitoxin system antitoxin component (TIGR02293 family)
MQATKSRSSQLRANGRPIAKEHRSGSLGLGTNEPLRLVHLVRQGLPFRRLAAFQKASELSWEKIGRVVQIAPRTLTRRQQQGRLRPDESDRVVRVSAIFDRAVDLFEGDPAAARRWLQTPQPALGGEAPLELSSTEIGARQVEDLIARLEHGVFP